MTEYTFGIEEEFFLSRRRTLAAAHQVPRALVKDLVAVDRRRVSTEMLQTQIETNTDICSTPAQAREQLRALRAGLAAVASAHDHVLFAAGTHPLARWRDLELTPKKRYQKIGRDLQMVGRRNMLCGLHVHVGVPDAVDRAELMRRAVPFLPLLLGLSLSSPFWEGHPTGLLGYRLSAYDEMPRTGFPPPFPDMTAYDAYVDGLVAAGVIPDASQLWWCIRPARRFPTLELRIADSVTEAEDALTVAAWFRCLVKALVEDRHFGSGLPPAGLAVVAENRWRIQRHGWRGTLVDPFSFEATPARAAMAALATTLAPHAAALRTEAEFGRWRTIVDGGTSADRQLRIHRDAMRAGASPTTALREVVRHLATETAGPHPLAEAA